MKTRGLRGSWIAHLRKMSEKVTVEPLYRIPLDDVANQISRHYRYIYGPKIKYCGILHRFLRFSLYNPT